MYKSLLPECLIAILATQVPMLLLHHTLRWHREVKSIHHRILPSTKQFSHHVLFAIRYCAQTTHIYMLNWSWTPFETKRFAFCFYFFFVSSVVVVHFFTGFVLSLFYTHPSYLDIEGKVEFDRIHIYIWKSVFHQALIFSININSNEGTAETRFFTNAMSRTTQPAFATVSKPNLKVPGQVFPARFSRNCEAWWYVLHGSCRCCVEVQIESLVMVFMFGSTGKFSSFYSGSTALT